MNKNDFTTIENPKHSGWSIMQVTNPLIKLNVNNYLPNKGNLSMLHWFLQD